MLPPDRMNEIGVLKRREIEARILLPVIEALGKEFGKDRVVEIVRDVIVDVAQAQGREVAAQQGGDSLGHLAKALQDWQKGDAYEMDVLEQNDERFSFNVTRCRYAELYRSLGIPELHKSSDDGQRGWRWRGKNSNPEAAAEKLTSFEA